MFLELLFIVLIIGNILTNATELKEETLEGESAIPVV